MYVMIRNPGIAPHECFTVFGASLSRFSDNENVIGEFGSGSKHAINLLIRQNIPPVIICGNLKMEFFPKIQTISDKHNTQRFSRVCIKYSGKLPDGTTKNTTEETGSMLEYGVKDWNETAMAMREFISNAIDMSIKETGSHHAVEIEIVDKIRAKSNHTSVFIQATQEILQYVQELPKRFLHFSGITETGPIEKQSNLTNSKTAMIYKKGVFVRELKTKHPSIFDYNFGNELDLDECRNVNDYTVQCKIAQIMPKISNDKKAIVLKQIVKDEWLESGLDTYYFESYCNDECKKQWKSMFEAIYGDMVITESGNMSRIPDLIASKGFQPLKVPHSWYKILKHCGVKSDQFILKDSEINNDEIYPATTDVSETLDTIFALLESLGLTKFKKKPHIFLFKSITNGEKTKLGEYYRNSQEIGINKDISVGKSDKLFQVVLEELAHHITGSGDCTRDFQNYLMQVIVEIYRKFLS